MKRSPLYWLGFFLLVLGAITTAVFVMKQLKESAAGHTYWEFIAAGVSLAIIGLIIVARMKRS